MSTWAERHPIISGLLTVAGCVLLLLLGFAALVLLIETVATFVSDTWKLVEEGS